MRYINIETMTMSDVIGVTYARYSQALCARMLEVAETHREHAAKTDDRVSREIAGRMCDNLRRMAVAIQARTLDVQALTLGERLQAFAAAAAVQGIPRTAQYRIAERS